jgi:LmbE family N-acetylglucosaminyl deacetylase
VCEDRLIALYPTDSDPQNGSLTVLHVAPHPDDELIGAPAALMAMQDKGHRIVNLAMSLGRPRDWKRRRDELTEASRRARFDVRIPNDLPRISADDDLDVAQQDVERILSRYLDALEPALVVSPSPHDRHHGHEVVARGIRAELARRTSPPTWWMWALWGTLPFPTLAVTFDKDRLEQIRGALGAYTGELSRNDYRRLVASRAEAQAVLGAELVFGFGAPGLDACYAELLTEVRRVDGSWLFGEARCLDPERPLAGATTWPADAWVNAPSAAQLVLG